MLDGKNYYTAFPDENSEMRIRMGDLLIRLVKLDREHRRNIEELRNEKPRSKGNSCNL